VRFGLALLLIPAQLHAETLRAVLRVPPGAEALAERVHGQTSDVDVEIRQDTAPIEASLPAQLAAADTIAARESVDVVVWCDRESDPPERLLVVVAMPRAGRVLVRRVEGEGSAALESAALIVRSALRALAAGAEIGVHRAEVAPVEQRPPRPSPGPAPETRAVRATPRTPAPAWIASLGSLSIWDFHSDAGQHGLAGRFGIAIRRLEVGLVAGVALPATLKDEYATLSLSRRHLAVFTGLRVVAANRLHVVVGAELGAAAWARSTVETAPGVVAAAPQVTYAPFAAPQVGLRWLALPALAGTLLLSADVVPGAPRIGLRPEGGGAIVGERRFGPVEPRALVLIELILG